MSQESADMKKKYTYKAVIRHDPVANTTTM